MYSKNSKCSNYFKMWSTILNERLQFKSHSIFNYLLDRKQPPDRNSTRIELTLIVTWIMNELIPSAVWCLHSHRRQECHGFYVLLVVCSCVYVSFVLCFKLLCSDNKTHVSILTSQLWLSDIGKKTTTIKSKIRQFKEQTEWNSYCENVDGKISECDIVWRNLDIFLIIILWQTCNGSWYESV